MTTRTLLCSLRVKHGRKQKVADYIPNMTTTHWYALTGTSLSLLPSSVTTICLLYPSRITSMISLIYLVSVILSLLRMMYHGTSPSSSHHLFDWRALTQLPLLLWPSSFARSQEGYRTSLKAIAEMAFWWPLYSLFTSPLSTDQSLATLSEEPARKKHAVFQGCLSFFSLINCWLVDLSFLFSCLLPVCLSLYFLL